MKHKCDARCSLVSVKYGIALSSGIYQSLIHFKQIIYAFDNKVHDKYMFFDWNLSSTADYIHRYAEYFYCETFKSQNG